MNWYQHWLLAFSKCPTIPENIWNADRNAHHYCPFWQGKGLYTQSARKENEKKNMTALGSSKVLKATMMLSQGKERWMASARTPGFCLELDLQTGGWRVLSKKTSLLESSGWVVVLWLPTEFSRWTWELDSSRDPGAAGNLELKFK